MEGIGSVNSNWDDYGFDPYENQIFKRILRRGICFESIPSMAKTCLMSIDKVRDAIRVLELAKAIACKKEAGKPIEMSVNPFEQWVARDRLQGIRAQVKRVRVTTPMEFSGTESHTPMEFRTTPLWNSVPLPLWNSIDKVNPLEVNPIKSSSFIGDEHDETAIAEKQNSGQVKQQSLFGGSENSQEETPPPTPAPKAAEFSVESFAEFWAEVPKKVGKEPTRKKFLKIKGITFSEFLEAYKAAKRIYEREKPADSTWQYFKRAETWINQCCWGDDEVIAEVRRSLNRSSQTAVVQAGSEDFSRWCEKAREAGYRFEVIEREGDQRVVMDGGMERTAAHIMRSLTFDLLERRIERLQQEKQTQAA